jgi:hypothetical protein
VDRVRIAPVHGERPPPTLKVTANLQAGWRNSMTLAITGAQVREKAQRASDTVWAGISGGKEAFEETAEDLSGDLTGNGLAYLRLSVRGDDERAVGRAFSGAVVETSLASYPGIFSTTAPSGAQAVARYWPTTIAVAEVPPRLECDGEPLTATGPSRITSHDRATDDDPAPRTPPPTAASEDHDQDRSTVRLPLGVLVGARSGDKGGNANIGLWADSDVVARWLAERLDTELLFSLLPELEPFEVTRHELPNLWAVNFVVHGILGWGVASNLRLDAQAKGLGELLRSRPVEVPRSLVAQGKPLERWQQAVKSDALGS